MESREREGGERGKEAMKMTVVSGPEKGSFEWPLSDLAGEPYCSVWFIGCFITSSKE
jgi:hypothetical protein